MKKVDSKYRPIPFWSWNDDLNEDELTEQIRWMNESGLGGFIMHARGGLKTPYLSEKWFSCINASVDEAEKHGMYPFAYDENGWPSGFVGGKLLENVRFLDCFLTSTIGTYDSNCLIAYDLSSAELVQTKSGENVLNVYLQKNYSTVDVCNKDVVKAFLQETHTRYEQNTSSNKLRGFFTDEPQYFRWATPFSLSLEEYFINHYNENIYDKIGLLFADKEGYREYRYRYYKAMQELFIDAFSKQVYEYCCQHDYYLTGHFIEESSLAGQMFGCGGVMPFYAYEHIPGIDFIGRWIPNNMAQRQLASVAAQLGKEQTLCEAFAGCGWDMSPMELKRIAEFNFVNGINLLCYHLVPYHENGQRKRDFPPHFSKINPWVKKDFKQFNDYISVLSEYLTTSQEVVDVAVFHPIRSAYFSYHREQAEGGYGIDEIEDSCKKLLCVLHEKHISYHFVDETLLAQYGSVEEGKLRVGQSLYQFLILPKLETMDKTSERLLCEYLRQNGKILLFDGKPSYLEGNKFDYKYLYSTTDWEEIVSNLPFSVPFKNENLYISLRKRGNEKFLYVVNVSEEEQNVVLHFKDAKAFRQYDVLRDEYNNIGEDLIFHKYESKILYPIQSRVEEEERHDLECLRLKSEFSVSPVKNYFTIDKLSYSFDGRQYQGEFYHYGILSTLLQQRYQGKLYLKYTFVVKNLTKDYCLSVEKGSFEELWVNDNKVLNATASEFGKDFEQYDISSLVLTGINEIIMLVNFRQNENAYISLNTTNATTSLKNCLTFETTIEPIYISGDFGVYGDFEKGKKKSLIGRNFYLSEQTHKKVFSLVRQGYPFMRGDIRLTQKVIITDTRKKLVFTKDFQYVEVWINGNEVARLMLTNEVNLSEYLHIGENEITLVLTLSNRNLFGPLHSLNHVDDFVGPNNYELFQVNRDGEHIPSWKNGRSDYFFEDYVFVDEIAEFGETNGAV